MEGAIKTTRRLACLYKKKNKPGGMRTYASLGCHAATERRKKITDNSV